MGRPSKQKPFVDKYFRKYSDGKTEKLKCIFCDESYSYNAFRCAKHLLRCQKTDARFLTDKEKIASLFKTTRRDLADNCSNCNAESASSASFDTIMPKFLRNDLNDQEPELEKENQDLVRHTVQFTSTNTCEIIDHQIPGSSTTTSNVNISDNVLNRIIKTEQSTLSEKSNSKTSGGYVECIRVQEEEDMWEVLARACYASGTPLNFIENVFWQEAFKKMYPCLKLPTLHQLSNTLLDAEYNKQENKMMEKINNAQFLSVQLCRCNDFRQEPLINVILTTPEPVVFKTVNAGVNIITREYMTSVIEDVIESLNSKKIISVVTDNVINVKYSRKILMEKFKDNNISYYGCVVHILNLLNRDILQLDIFSLLDDYAKKICVEFKQSRVLISLLQEFQNADPKILNKEKPLGLPIVTYWNLNVQCLKRLISNKQYLQQVAVSPKADKYLTKDSSLKILDNDVFWLQIETLLNILEPISVWIKIFESETSNLSDVVCAFYDIKKKINDSSSQFQEKQRVLFYIENRRKMATLSIHLAAHLLDPKYKGKYLTEEESINASQFIHSLADYIEVNQGDVLCDLANYKTNAGLWSKDFVWSCLNTETNDAQLNIITWWNGICSTTKLARVASAILQCPPTSTTANKFFSSNGVVHTAQINGLTSERVSKLVYVKHNLELQMNNNCKVESIITE